MSSIIRVVTTCILSILAPQIAAARALPQRVLPSGSFELNIGQHAPSIAFAARFGAFDAAVLKTGAVLLAMPGSSSPLTISVGPKLETDELITGEEKSEYQTNYISDRGQFLDIPHYSKVRASSVYPGIDLLFHSQDGELELDLVVAPGADASAIQFRLGGAREVKLTDNGELEISIGSAQIRQRKPIAYQLIGDERIQIACNYELTASDRVALVVGSYDKRLPLVIDPIVDYSSYLGGTTSDNARDVRIGGDGFLYVAGTTSSSNFPVVNAFDATLGGSSDAFIAKINPATGKAVWATYLGGANADTGLTLAVDSTNAVYVAGVPDARFPTTSGAYQTAASGEYGFVAKLSAAGNALVYSTLVSGTRPKALTVDSQGRAILVGEAGTQFTTTAGAYQAVAKGAAGASSGEAFVLMLNATGTAAVFATFVGGTGNDIARSVAIDSAGQLLIGGSTQSSDFPVSAAPAPLQSSLRGSRDGFIARLAANGATLTYSSYFGGTNSDEIVSLSADPYGNVVFGGNTSSGDLPLVNPLLSASQLEIWYVDLANRPVFEKGFVGKMAIGAGASLTFSTYTGGNIACCDSLHALAVDALGDIYISGSSRVDGHHKLAAVNPYLSSSLVWSKYSSAPDYDALFAAAYTRDGGKLRFQGYTAGCPLVSNGCQPSAIAAKGAGFAFIGGSTSGTWLPIAALNTQPISKVPSGANTAFMTTLSFEPPALTIEASNGTPPANSAVTLAAWLWSAGVTGQVSFYDGETVIGTAPIIEGVARLTTSFAPGVRRIKASIGSSATSIMLLPVRVPAGSCPA